MRYMKKWFAVLMLCLWPLLQASAQSNDEQLAQQYLSNGEYDKAVILYEKLIEKIPGSMYFYENLLTCYKQLKQEDDAVKLAKRLGRRFEDQPIYKVDQIILISARDKNKGKKELDKLWKEMPPTEMTITRISEAFEKRGLYAEAIQTLKIGRLKIGNPEAWHVALGRLYGIVGERSLMIDEYLAAVQTNAADLDAVENNLQQGMGDSAQAAQLKQALTDRLKTDPANESIMEMLIWYSVQQRDFMTALHQVKMIDRRQKGEGKRIFELAGIAGTNNAFDAAIACCSYIMALGRNLRYYNDAQNLQLQMRRKKVVNGIYNKQDLLQLENDYKSFIGEFGENPATATSMKDLAELYAYYLDQPDSAIMLLASLSEMYRLPAKFRAECKLMLGDVYILIGNYWDPVLYYGQVDKEFKEDELGQEAKFRNARLSYYKGEFEWAQAQLDILKKATSQLISNNSIELALLIQDNLGLDSNEEAMKIFADAELYIYQHKFKEAMAALDTIYARFPQHSLADEILYAKARIFRMQQQWQPAVDLLEKVYTVFGFDILADNALFDAAEIYEFNLKQPDQAMKLYEKLITDFPGSLYTVEARKRFRILRGDLVN